VDHTDGSPTGRRPFPELLTAAPYVDWLVRVLLEAADEERSALRAARLPTAVTLPVTVVRHQCPYCRRTWAKRPAATAHVARCWSNPEVRPARRASTTSRVRLRAAAGVIRTATVPKSPRAVQSEPPRR